MSVQNRAAGRGSKTGTKTEPNVTIQQTVKTETIKVVEKEKKQPTADQIRIATLTDKGDATPVDMEVIKRIQDVTCKTEEEIVFALYDCENNENDAIAFLIENKQGEWSTTTKKKKNRTASASKNASTNNHGEATENSEDWDKDASASTGHMNDKNNRGLRGRRPGGTRMGDRGTFRRYRGRENKENERGGEDGSSMSGGPNRDFRGRGDRMANGPSRMGRSRGGPRTSRGPGGTRTFQSRDNNDRGGGFPRQIDTWNNPETENSISKAGEFPSPEDWDNEEYTGSLADTKVFTPSTSVEPETGDGVAPIENELKDDSVQLHLPIQSSPNQASIQTIVVGSKQLTAAQSQYFSQLTARSDENRMQQAQQQTASPQVTQKTPPQVQPGQSSVIYNSSISSSPQQAFSTAVTQPSFSAVSQSYGSGTPSHAFTAMVSSQTFQPSPSSSYQSPSSIAGSASYSRAASEYTSSNYSDVINNYSSMVGLSTNGALPQRSKPQRSSSRHETPTKVIPGSVDMPVSDAIKYLDSQFSTTLDFTKSDSFDSTSATNDQSSVSALSNKYSPSVPANPTLHADLPAMNTFQTTQSSKQNLPSSNVSSVLSQNSKLSSESPLQNDNSVYSSQTITNSRMAPTIQDIKNSPEVSSLTYGIQEAYQSQQQQSSFPKSSSNVSTSFHQSGTSVSSYSSSNYGASTPIISTANNVYSAQQQQSQQQQQQSQISAAGVTYSTSSSTPFSYSTTTSHSVATATPPLHNSVYHSSSYQPHPAVSAASFQSYLSYPSSLMQPYQAGATGLTQAPYLSTQYGGGSLASLGPTYGAAAFHNNYGMNSNLQTPVAALQQSHKISSSLSSSAGSKESQYDSLQAITSTNNTVTTTSGSVISGLTQASTTTSSKVSSSSSSGSKSSGMLPSIPPGVTPLIQPQYIMSQGLPMYQPAFALNYDDLQYLPRGMHPHMPTGYLDLNYAAAQTNLAAAGRDALSVPFSSISDGRFPRPDNTTSPVPPTAAAAASAPLSQQNTAPTHQQAHMPLLQTYAAAYIYPPYQQYTTTPVYQVAPTGTPAAPGSASNSALTATPFAKAPTGYSSTGYASQYDSLGSSQGSVQDYTGKGNSASAYSNTQAPNKASGNAGSGSSQGANAGNADLSMYTKSHASLTKSYDKQTFHSGTPPPFTMPGSGTTSSNLGNVSNVSAAAGYAPQLYIPNAPAVAAGAHQQHHMHPNAHHQDAADIRNSGSNDRTFFLSSNRSSYR